MFLKKKGGAVEWLVVCLGNPGIQYSSTRHNVGFHAADALEERCGVRLNRLKFQALTGEVRLGGSRVLVLKPQTMMNRSGQAVQQAAAFYKIPPERVLVIFDDISLPVGKLRVRPGGSAGGHNGVKNIIACLGSDGFPRVKIGVGEKPNPDYDLAAWELGRPTAAEWKTLEETSRRGLDAAECVISEGCAAAMSRFN